MYVMFVFHCISLLYPLGVFLIFNLANSEAILYYFLIKNEETLEHL